MANHTLPSKSSLLARAAGGALVVGAVGVGAVALSSAIAPVEANAACGNGLSAFSNTGTNNPNTLNLGSGNNINTQFGGSNLGGFQRSRTGNNNSTNTGNPTTCTSVSANPFAFPSIGFGNNTGTNNPNTFNVFSGNNINTQIGFGPNVGGRQSASTGNNNSTNTGNPTTVTNVN